MRSASGNECLAQFVFAFCILRECSLKLPLRKHGQNVVCIHNFIACSIRLFHCCHSLHSTRSASFTIAGLTWTELFRAFLPISYCCGSGESNVRLVLTQQPFLDRRFSNTVNC